MAARSAFIRLSAFALFVALWWWLHKAHPQWLAPVKDRIRNVPSRYDNTAALVAAITLALFIAACLWGRFSPRRTRGYDAAIGEGCLSIAAIALGVVAVLLAIAWLFHIPALIWFIAFFTVVPAIHLSICLVYEGVKSLRKKHATRV